MQIFKNSNFNFIAKRKIMYVFSAVLILIGIVSIFMKGGLKYSIDFTGGFSIEVSIAEKSIQDIRNAFVNTNYNDIEVQTISDVYGNKCFVLKSQVKGKSSEIINILKENFPKETKDSDFVRSIDIVGPKIGKELKEKAILAIIYSLIGIIVYIWWRFKFTFGVAAVVALVHDVLITIGIFSLLNKEISLSIIAAVLTIVGYSLNDTIVVFDRIREGMKKYHKEKFDIIINKSINETLNRTMITSFTTLLSLFSLYFLGSNIIKDFSLALIVGVFVGTYSSIFIASTLLLIKNKK